MTTPIVEPYGEIFHRSTAGSGGFDAPSWRKLPPGVNTLMITWPGTQHLNISLRRGGTTATPAQIGRIEPGTTRRNIVIPGVGVSAGEIVEVGLSTFGAQETGVPATMTVVTTPLKGAGGGVVSGGLWGLLAVLRGGRSDHANQRSSRTIRRAHDLRPQRHSTPVAPGTSGPRHHQPVTSVDAGCHAHDLRNIHVLRADTYGDSICRNPGGGQAHPSHTQSGRKLCPVECLAPKRRSAQVLYREYCSRADRGAVSAGVAHPVQLVALVGGAA